MSRNAISRAQPCATIASLAPLRAGFVSRLTLGAIAALFAFATIGCGSAVGTERAYTQTTATVRAAEAIGAKDTPKAALHLKMARDGLTEAEALMADDENDEAILVLDRAEADADLALALAQESEAKAEAQEALDKVEALRQEASPQ